MQVGVIVLGIIFPSTLALSPFSFGVPQKEVARPFPKVFGLLKYLNPFSFLVVRQESEPRTAVGFCEGTGGQMVGEECLEFVSTPRNFFDAIHFCRGKGGTLWVPTTEDLSNPFFFQKLLQSFPGFFKAISSEILLGISKGMTTGYKGIDGTDLSTAPWVRTNDEPTIKDNLCAVFDYSLGHLQFQPVKCEVAKNFVCKYPVHGRKSSVQEYDDQPDYYQRNRQWFLGKPFYLGGASRV